MNTKIKKGAIFFALVIASVSIYNAFLRDYAKKLPVIGNYL